MDRSSAAPTPSVVGIVVDAEQFGAMLTPQMRGTSIAFFAQDLSDVSTIKRVQQFFSRGFTVMVLGFRRDRYNSDFKPPWPHLLLGYTQDRRYMQRIWTMIAAIPKLWAERPYLNCASIFYTRNLDQLVMALIIKALTNHAATIVYEVLDIQPIQAGRGLSSILLRWVERICLRHVRYLVLSSAGFYRHYYAPIQNYKGAWILLENKLPEPIRNVLRGSPAPLMLPNQAHRVWRIGYFGLIRGQATIDLIVRLAQRLGDRVHFHFRGVFTTVDEGRFRAALEALPNVSFGGRFRNPEDLAELYNGVDLAWGIDLENADSNSRWLLPCRLYEAGYFAVPCLAARGFELGNRVERLRIGWAFDAPFEDALGRFLETLTSEEYEAKRQTLRSMPGSTFVSGVDLDALCRVLADPEWAFPDRHRSGIEQPAG